MATSRRSVHLVSILHDLLTRWTVLPRRCKGRLCQKFATEPECAYTAPRCWLHIKGRTHVARPLVMGPRKGPGDGRLYAHAGCWETRGGKRSPGRRRTRRRSRRERKRGKPGDGRLYAHAGRCEARGGRGRRASDVLLPGKCKQVQINTVKRTHQV
jgi:hypothetical protein